MSLPTDSLSATIRRLADEVGPAVVAVNRRGCGVVVADGVILTNAHNLGEHEVELLFADGRRERASVAGVDPEGDLAVLHADTTGVRPLRDAPAPATLGDVVFGLSRAGGATLRVTAGAVSSVGHSFRGPRGRRIRGSLEHTAPLVRGSSGGPVVDGEGRLVGLNTHRVDEGFYLAIPAGADLRAAAEGLSAGSVTRRPSLGIAVVPPRAARHLREAVGLPPLDAPLVRAVDPDGPAARAGLRQGDVITGAGETTISSIDDLHLALERAGSSITLRITRQSEEIEVLVDFAAAPATSGEA